MGFVDGGGREFWVVGWYGASRIISRVSPVDEYYMDAVVMGFEGGAWQEVEDVWGDGERVRVRKIVVVNDEPVYQCLFFVSNEF